MEDYYKTYYVQSWIFQPDGFGWGIWVFADGAPIQGMYIQDQSSQMRIAESQGYKSVGTFVTGINVLLEEGDYVRDPDKNIIIKIVGMPVQSPDIAVSQLRRMNAEISETPAP